MSVYIPKFSKKIREIFQRSVMLRGSRDNWEKLVGAVLDREELRRLAYCESLSSSTSSDFSFDFLASAAPTTSHHGAPPQPIKLKELKKATKSFHHDRWLGEGGFGPVFKGWINDHTLRASKHGSGMPVAVKKWTRGSMLGYHEYLKEVNYLSQLHHPNLVRLIGYSSEEDNLILVYEFMPKGSLDNHLFRGRHQSLSWKTRMKVAIGAAKALSFMHDRATPVIHRGCECSYILLDGEFNAKLSDFGFARDGPTGGETHVSTRVVGSGAITVAPEYAATGYLTEKSDVYSFGCVLLELISGSRAFDINRPRQKQNQVEWIQRYVGDETEILKIMDSRLEGRFPPVEAYTVAKLACSCLSMLPTERPRMSEVVVVLQVLQPGEYERMQTLTITKLNHISEISAPYNFFLG